MILRHLYTEGMHADITESNDTVPAVGQAEPGALLSCASLLQALDNATKEAALGVAMVEELSYLQAQLLATAHRLHVRNLPINFQVRRMTSELQCASQDSTAFNLAILPIYSSWLKALLSRCTQCAVPYITSDHEVSLVSNSTAAYLYADTMQSHCCALKVHYLVEQGVVQFLVALGTHTDSKH
jgi:hypothetical protein